jgi:gluconate 2-dehydrogenase gamma chain
VSDSPAASQSSRRTFLKGVAGAAAVIPIVSLAAAPAPQPAPLPPGYESLGPKEAAFVEAMVNVMCPADALTPNGVDCGLATFIDRQLAGGFGKGDRYYMLGPWRSGPAELGLQSPLTPEQFFRSGIAAANDACGKQYGKTFDQLAHADANAFLEQISATGALAPWFNELVYPLFQQACFADPMYGGNRAKVFWKMVGYPGLPAFHTQDRVAFRGKPFPGAQSPQSIQDFA